MFWWLVFDGSNVDEVLLGLLNRGVVEEFIIIFGGFGKVGSFEGVFDENGSYVLLFGVCGIGSVIGGGKGRMVEVGRDNEGGGVDKGVVLDFDGFGWIGFGWLLGLVLVYLIIGCGGGWVGCFSGGGDKGVVLGFDGFGWIGFGLLLGLVLVCWIIGLLIFGGFVFFWGGMFLVIGGGDVKGGGGCCGGCDGDEIGEGVVISGSWGVVNGEGIIVLFFGGDGVNGIWIIGVGGGLMLLFIGEGVGGDGGGLVFLLFMILDFGGVVGVREDIF